MKDGDGAMECGQACGRISTTVSIGVYMSVCTRVDMSPSLVRVCVCVPRPVLLQFEDVHGLCVAGSAEELSVRAE